MKFSKSSGGFFDTEINGECCPADAVEISIDLWQELLIAQANGKVILGNSVGFPVALDKPPDSPPSTDELKAAYVNAVQNALDTKAKERGYDGILSLCTYAASSGIPVFLSEGQAGVVWRDTSWLTCYQMLESWQAGTIAQPSIAEVLAALPVMMWPDEEE